MKHFASALLFVLIALTGRTQSAEQYVINTAADSSNKVPGYTVHFTVGESIIGTSVRRYMMVTQGFEQANLELSKSLVLSGQFANNRSRLTWTTPFEVNNDHFIIERSSDTLNAYQPLGRIPSRATTGNSATALDYNTIDSFPLQSVNYYRVKMVGKDGIVTYSNTIALIMEGEEIWLESMYPNPAKDILNLKLFARANTRVTLSIVDQLGRTMMAQSFDLQKGRNLKQLIVAKLAAAVYYVHVKDDRTGKRLVAKMIKVN